MEAHSNERVVDLRMRETGFGSLNLATSALVWLATLAATAAVGVTGAYWTWAWFAPRPEPGMQVVAPALARLDLAHRLFGSVRSTRSGSAAPGGTAFQLLGLVAASGEEPGYAILKLDGKRFVTIRQGTDIEPGTRLVEVNADHVVLDRSGIRETLALPKQGRNAATAVKRAQ